MKSKVFDDSWKKEFGKRLDQRIEKWIEKESKYTASEVTYEDFAKKVGYIAGTQITRQEIYRYRKGLTKPGAENFAAICEVLGCDESELLPADHKEQYSHNREYMRGVLRDKERFAHQIGLNKEFVRWLSSSDEYCNEFPLFLPIIRNYVVFDGDPFIRMNPAAAVKLNSCFQVSYNGKTVTLSDNDLLFLKELQDLTEAFVKQKLKEKQEEYDKELEEKNAQHTEIDKNGVEWQYWN